MLDSHSLLTIAHNQALSIASERLFCDYSYVSHVALVTFERFKDEVEHQNKNYLTLLFMS